MPSKATCTLIPCCRMRTLFLDISLQNVRVSMIVFILVYCPCRAS